MTGISANYDRLIQDLRRDFRPQREWSEGRGLFLVIGHFVVGIAAGAWLLGLWYDYLPGLLASVALAGLGGIAHLLFLGRPERCWRMARRVATSWVARGFIGLVMFLAGAALYLPPRLVPWLWAGNSVPASLGWLAAAGGAVVLVVYMGFVYKASKGIPFWNSPLHPVLYMLYAARGGAAALLIAMTVAGAPAGDAINSLLRLWLAATGAVLVLFVLELWHALAGGNPAARRSARELLAGRLALTFYGGGLLIGLVIPALLVGGQLTSTDLAAVAAVGSLSVAGDFFMKYATIRAGIHLPLAYNLRSAR